MSPTTREVEAARVERMRRAAAQRDAKAAEQPAPRTRAERLERTSTGPRWACRLDGCALAHLWHPANTVALAEAEAQRHYLTRHYQPDPPYALRGLGASSP